MRKESMERREYKYFNVSIVILVFIYLKSMQLVTITVKKTTGGSRFDYGPFIGLLIIVRPI